MLEMSNFGKKKPRLLSEGGVHASRCHDSTYVDPTLPSSLPTRLSEWFTELGGRVKRHGRAMPITSEGIDKYQRVAALGWVNLVMDESIGEDFSDGSFDL